MSACVLEGKRRPERQTMTMRTPPKVVDAPAVAQKKATQKTVPGKCSAMSIRTADVSQRIEWHTEEATQLELQDFAESLLRDCSINDADDRDTLSLFSNARRVVKYCSAKAVYITASHRDSVAAGDPASTNLDGSRQLAGASTVTRVVRNTHGTLLGGIVLEQIGTSSAGSASRGKDQVRLISLMVHHMHQRAGVGRMLLLEGLEECARRAAGNVGTAFSFSIDFGGCEGSSWPFFNRVLHMCTMVDIDGFACYATPPFECSSRDGGCCFKRGNHFCGGVRSKILGCAPKPPHLVVDPLKIC